MIGPERQSKNYQLIARILETSLKQALNITHIASRASANIMDTQDYVDYLCDMGLLDSMELFGSKSFGRATRVYWTSSKGKKLLAHLDAMNQIAGLDPEMARQ